MTLRETIAAVTGSEVSGANKLAGGDLGGALLVELADGGRLVAKHGPLVAREAEMLRAIAAAGAPAPKVLHAEGELLLMEHVEADGEAGWDSLADALNLLHAGQEAPFGWDADYAFGPVPIFNTQAENWSRFWAQNRLLCHGEKVDGSLTRRLEALAKRLPSILPATPPPALLHGDLWGGNVLFNRGKLVALIDPACYIGHREVDVAMLTLFDFPPDSFFDALELEPGWRERLPVYRLWPLLVHLRLFGHAYRQRVKAELGKLGF
ncbi:fructosamine kinase family protein [Aurantiacibacter sp. MUD11]|uniref:fructosamine kinase family protein n=1 Tax=Aurantiacibacter sp. MUD11 TaxID=3003265 RepID=UPI0022AAA18B|nr:fructosamine kinase family protein [Aurantiacibacter sp. MUD11]WAT17616.1 fructosamine kinase family protein [Aurantiacibacter sp. MUD11]